jgi:GTP cyclohydrolase I
MTPALFRGMASEMLPLLHAERGDITAAFPYFINKSAPISGVQSLLDYEVQWIARADGGQVEFELVVQVPVTSLCPCSKAISQYGAHNQRSHVTVSAVMRDDFVMDDIIRAIEEEGSCELWGLLKRPDEKYVTERAYDNPKFVEDLVRDVAARMAAQPGVARYRVEAENFESIHNHSAYAVVEG